MANYSPISGDSKQAAAALQLSSRLQSCWKADFDWTLVPPSLKEVRFNLNQFRHGTSKY